MNLSPNTLNRTAARWTTTGESIFSEMTALANQYNAVNLGQGAPDFYGPTKLLDAISHQLYHCHNQYAPSPGELRLRQQISRLVHLNTGVTYTPSDEVTITNGASGGIFCAINAFVNPGDKVLIFEPAFDLYFQAIANAGGIPVPVRLHAPDTQLGIANNFKWTLDWKELEDISANGFSFAIFNSPHNPTGKVFTEEEMRRISAYILKNEALVLTDEVYENFTFDDAKHISMCSFPEIQHLVIRVSSAAKTFGFTGLKVGWVCAPASLSKAIRLVQQSTVFCVSPFTQLGLADVMEDQNWLDAFLNQQRNNYLEKRNFLKSVLERAGYQICNPDGSYFITASYESLFGDISDDVCAKQLVENRCIATIPLSPFYSVPPKNLPWLRFAFCKKQETLRAAADMLLH